jgi:hypothetical protein
VLVRYWFPADVVESRWLVTVVFAAAAGAAVLTTVTGPAGHSERQLLIPLLASVVVIALRRWPLPVLGVVTVAAGFVTANGLASLSSGVLLGLSLYFSALDGAGQLMRSVVFRQR